MSTPHPPVSPSAPPSYHNDEKEEENKKPQEIPSHIAVVIVNIEFMDGTTKQIPIGATRIMNYAEIILSANVFPICQCKDVKSVSIIRS